MRCLISCCAKNSLGIGKSWSDFDPNLDIESLKRVFISARKVFEYNVQVGGKQVQNQRVGERMNALINSISIVY